jgi:hypothetical protein
MYQHMGTLSPFAYNDQQFIYIMAIWLTEHFTTDEQNCHLTITILYHICTGV